MFGDPRDFEIFEEEIDEEGANCIVPVLSGYNYPELIDDPKNKRLLSINSIKRAFRAFINHKISHGPEGVILERINVNKHTFHDVKNSMLVSLQSYQKMIEGRKAEYFGEQNIYKEDPLLSELLKASKQKDSVIKQMQEGKISHKDALAKATPLQFKITELEGKVVEQYYEKNLGKIANTFHDNEFESIPLKLYVIPPNMQRKCGVLITSGMSAYPMMAPSMAEPINSELFMLLSPDWPLPLDSIRQDDFSWTVKKLFDMVKYVHGNKQWFSIGHTFGNGDPPKPFAKNTALCAFLFRTPLKELPPTFCELKIGHKPVYLLQVMPIYEEEMNYIMRNGPEGFNSQILSNDHPEYIELNREKIIDIKLCKNIQKSE